MGVLDRFERGIDRVVNGAFARAFRSQVEPVELASALRREADNRAAVVSRGRTLTANTYAVELSNADFERLEPIAGELRQDLRQVVGDHAIEQGYSFVGPIAITFEVAQDLDTGMYRIRATTRRPDGSPAAQPPNRGGYDPPSRSNPIVHSDSPSGPVSSAQNYVSGEQQSHSGSARASAPHSAPTPTAAPPVAGPPVAAPPVVAPGAPAPDAPGSRRRGESQPGSSQHGSSQRGTAPAAAQTFSPAVRAQGHIYPLSQGTTVFGRSANSADVAIDDPGMSRRHFEITVAGDRVIATDLESTNGTLLNGRPIGSITLSEGTVLTAGDTPITYSEAGRFRE